MGRCVVVELWSEHGAAGEAAMASVMAEMHRVDRTTSALKPHSELSRINREAALGPVRLSEEMFVLLQRGLAFAALTRGAFDLVRPAPGRSREAWAPRGMRPPRRTAADPAPADWRALDLDVDGRSLRFARPGLRIEIAGLARAHALDRCWALLQQRGIAHARISAGGDSRVIGDRRGRPWSIGIGASPRDERQVLALLPLTDRAVSSAAAEGPGFPGEEGPSIRRAGDADGLPSRAPSLRCGAVLADDCVTAHAMARAVLALGAKAGLRLADRQPRVDALLVDAQGRLRRTKGLRDDGARAHAH